jgi:hypothetical protein
MVASGLFISFIHSQVCVLVEAITRFHHGQVRRWSNRGRDISEKEASSVYSAPNTPYFQGLLIISNEVEASSLTKPMSPSYLTVFQSYQ